MVASVWDIELDDRQLLGEIELVTELMVAASHASGLLDQRTIDRILGVVPARVRARAVGAAR